MNATAAGFRAAATVDVTVTQPAISLFSLPGLVGAGLQSGTYTARLGATAHGGVTVRITSSNPALLLVSRDASTVGTTWSTSRWPTAAPTATYYITGSRGRAGR